MIDALPPMANIDKETAAIAANCSHTIRHSVDGNWEFTSAGVAAFARDIEKCALAKASILNLNDRFVVTLTEEGAKVMTAWYEQFPAAYRKNAEPGTVLVEPLWHLMQIFGDKMIMGRPPVFVDNKLEVKERG